MIDGTGIRAWKVRRPQLDDATGLISAGLAGDDRAGQARASCRRGSMMRGRPLHHPGCGAVARRFLFTQGFESA
jgi:hypothetical protein